MLNKANVLVVENDESLQELICTTLEVEGYQVLCARNGKVGLQHATQRRPDIILLDINLPIMTGHAFIEAYHQRTEVHVPIIALTGQGWDYRQILGISGFVKKPFELANLVLTIEGVLRRYKYS